MQNQYVPNLLLASLLISSGIVSAATVPSVSITGSKPAQINIKTAQNDVSSTKNAVTQRKFISYEKIKLSPAAASYLANAADKPADIRFPAVSKAFTLPASATLGMNNVPVLDQGQHGTCVTFADAGAVDAAHGNTDYISELCNLELGLTLKDENAKTGVEYPSGWDGSWNEIVLGQIQKYGIVTMGYQQLYGCGNATTKLKQYPLSDPNNDGVPMSTTDFARHSEQIMKDIYWRTLLNEADAFTDKVNMNDVLNNVKQSIVNGHRVVFAMLLDDNGKLGDINGADGAYHGIKNDAWIVTRAIKKDLKANKIKAGHALIITGFDDNAQIVGSDGTKHTGVLTLRNSWSSDAGESGNYYMSYEYFTLLAMEAQEISPTPFA